MNKVFNSITYSKAFDFSDIDKKRIKILLSMLKDSPKILDLGCGDGTLMESLISNHEVLGLDVSGPALDIARKKGLIVRDMDLTSNWGSEVGLKFDAVLAGEVIEHIFDTDKFLKNIHKVLKKKGHLVLSTPNVASLPRRALLFLGVSPYLEITSRKYDAGHVRYFTFRTLEKLLTENNFKVVEYKSDGVNIDGSGNRFISLITNIFPTLGRSIIIRAQKV